MDKYETRKIIQDYIREICHYGQMQVFATSYYQSSFFQRQIDEVTDRLVCFCLEQPDIDLHEQQTEAPSEGRTFTPEELAFYDGSSGRSAYVAVNGNVYDVTMLIRWAGGTHFGVYAGKDLTVPFMGCHQGVKEVLRNVPKIGTLQQ